MDNKGIISSEVIIILILILLILGIIVNFTERTENELTEVVSSENNEKIAIEFCDNLINTPGSPNNWNTLKHKNNAIAGLAIIDENNHTIPNSVSYEKFMALKENYKKLMDNNHFKSSITLKPLTGSIPEITIGDNLKNPVTVNRIISCDFFKKYVVNSFEDNMKCNDHHLTPHSCNHFKVFKSWLKKTDYYILFEKNSYKDTYYKIDSTKIPGFSKVAESDKIYLNPKIEEKLLLDKEGIIFIHINKLNPKAVLIGIPKDFDKEKLNYDYFVKTECNFMVQTSNY